MLQSGVFQSSLEICCYCWSIFSSTLQIPIKCPFQIFVHRENLFEKYACRGSRIMKLGIQFNKGFN